MDIYVLTGILAVAAVWDLFYTRIPNVLIAAGYMMAFCSVLAQEEGVIKDRLCGLVLPCLLGFVYFASGNLGAGDLKLFSVVGAFLGVKATLHCMGGAIAAGAATGGIKIILEAGRWRRYPRKCTIPFAPSILCGTLIVLIEPHLKG